MKNGDNAMRAYVDTNIFIYIFEKHADFGTLSADALASYDNLVTSTITITEALSKTTEDVSLASFTLFPKLETTSLTTLLANHAGEIRRKTNLELGDAIHLATALAANASVLITNDRKFAKIAAAYLPAETLEANA